MKPIPKFIKHHWWGYLSFQAMPKYLEMFEKEDLPNNIRFETRSKCNGRCNFCGASVGNDIRDDVLMPIELFQSVIEQLVYLEYGGSINLFHYNEPLLDKRISEFIRYAHKHLSDATIRITTNGTMLSDKKIHSLFDAGLSSMVVDNYGSDPKIKRGVCGSKHFGSIQYFDRNRDEILNNMAGYSPNKPPLDKPLKAFCSYAFFDFIILPSGNVSICCPGDPYGDHVMGNVLVSSIPDIWDGERFNNVRGRLIRGDRGFSPCNVCDCPGYRSNMSFGIVRDFVKIYLVGRF